MRILLYNHAYPGSGHVAGSETSLHDLGKTLQAQGHDVAALLGELPKNGRQDNYTHDGIPVFVPTSRKDVKNQPLQMFAVTDCIITQNACSQRGSMLARMLGKKVVHYVHNDGTHALSMVKRYTDLAIYNTEWIKRDFEKDVSVPGIVFHPAVNPENYRVQRNRGSKYITLVNLSKGDNQISYNKGYETFFELARRNPNEAFLGVRGAYGNQAFEDLPNVTYMDHTEDIREALKKSRVVIVPSGYESFGRIAVEAAASGIPAICTETEGTREAMGTSCLYSTFGDHDHWNHQLHILLNDWDKYSAVAKKRSEFNWQRTQSEAQEVGIAFEILATDGVQALRDYLEV